MSIKPIKISELSGESLVALKALFPSQTKVYLFTFENQTFTSTLTLVANISQAIMNSSVVLIYYYPSSEQDGSWYALPGPGPLGAYMLRVKYDRTSEDPEQYTFTINAHNFSTGAANTSPKTFIKTRIYVIQQFPIT